MTVTNAPPFTSGAWRTMLMVVGVGKAWAGPGAASSATGSVTAGTAAKMARRRSVRTCFSLPRGCYVIFTVVNADVQATVPHKLTVATALPAIQPETGPAGTSTLSVCRAPSQEMAIAVLS